MKQEFLMHNCKLTREQFTEALLQEPNKTFISDCELCRNEFKSLQNTLRITARALETRTPSEGYWLAYDARLKQNLNDSCHRVAVSEPSWLVRLFSSSIRVPVPVGLALMLVFGLTAAFAIFKSSTKFVPEPAATIVHVPVEVPVIQEKVVTRVVYRNRKPGQKRIEQTTSASESILAQKSRSEPASLIGFKPLDEIKLTVIKGGSPDEK
jgi:hypothetical protein